MTSNQKTRCFGNKPNQILYAQYHDKEWGIPEHNDHKLFEMLVLEGAQAGLNWETVLKKREGYRQVFYQFDPERVASMTDKDLETIRLNPSIIRNRLKIASARQNAKIFLAIQKEYGTFDHYLWRFVEGKPIINHWTCSEDVPSTTKESDALSKDLKHRGMSFVGSTIIYAYMQAIGLVNDHLTSCWCYTT